MLRLLGIALPTCAASVTAALAGVAARMTSVSLARRV
jgi:hypothetical protein